MSVFVTHGLDWRPLGDGRKRTKDDEEMNGTMASCLSCRGNQSVKERRKGKKTYRWSDSQW